MILNIGYGISIGRLILSVIFILDGNNDGTFLGFKPGYDVSDKLKNRNGS